MSASAWAMLNYAKGRFGRKEIDFSADAFKVVLLGAAQALSATFVGTSTQARYSDLTDEFTTTGGYTAGGLAIGSQTWTETSAGLWTFDSADLTWTTLTLASIKYAAIIDTTPATDFIVAFSELNVGGTVSSAGTDFSIVINAAGYLDLT